MRDVARGLMSRVGGSVDLMGGCRYLRNISWVWWGG